MATSNSLEWIISLKDKVSGVADKVTASLTKTTEVIGGVTESAKKIPQAVSKAFGSFYVKAKAAVKGPEFLSSSVEELKQRLEEVNKVRLNTVLKSEFKEASKEAKALENQIKRLEQGISGSGIGAKIAGWRKDFANSLPGANLIKNPLTAAFSVVTGLTKATSRAMEDQVDKMEFIIATGSEKIGTSLHDGITSFAAKSGLGDELNSAVMKMIGQGVDSGKILPIMEQMGDISQGSAAGFDKLAGAFQAVSNRGMMSERRLRDLRSIGFDPLQVLADNTGESIESLNARMKKGDINITDLTRAMQFATSEGGKFHGAIDKIANTPEGQLRQLRQNIDNMMIRLGNIFLPIAEKVMQFLNWISEKAGPLLEPLAVVFGVVSVAVLGYAAAQWVANLALWSFPLTWIIAGIAALIGTIVWLVTSVTGWGEAWKHTVNGAKLLWEAFTTHMKLAFDTTVDGIMIGVNKIKEGWYKFKNAVGLGDSDENDEMIRQIHQDTERRKNEIVEGQKKITELYVASAGEFAKAAGSLSFKKKNEVESPEGAPGTTNGDTKGNGLDEDEASKTNEAIATGGTRNTTINMTIGNIVETLNLKAQDLKEGAQQTQDELAAALLRALAMATTTAG